MTADTLTASYCRFLKPDNTARPRTAPSRVPAAPKGVETPAWVWQPLVVVRASGTCSNGPLLPWVRRWRCRRRGER